MRLLRHGRLGQERPGLLDAGGTIRDLSGHLRDLDPSTLARLGDLRGIDPAALPALPEGTRFGPVIGQCGKFVCIGMNYADHAKEVGMPVPKEPVIFLKATSAICGPNDDIVIPPGAAAVDWEVELGVVIGTTARRVTEQAAPNHVAGYCVVNDLSERIWQTQRGGEFTKGKSADTFGPIGPWLVTPDEVPDPQSLDMWLEVDGHRFQNGSTRTMVFGVAALVAYASQSMTLHPGDIISTGTPPGVGAAQDPRVFLRPGQVMRLGIAGLGEQVQRVAAADA